MSCQVVRFRRAGQAKLAQAERALAKQLHQYPALRPYARQPYTTYLVWAVLGIPSLVLVLPVLLVLTGELQS